MKSTLRTRLLKGVGANVFGQAVTAIIQLVSVPLLLYFWGKALFGEWLILSAMPLYVLYSGYGLSYASGNEMTMLVAQGRRREALEVFQNAGILIIGFSMVLATLAATLFMLGSGGYLSGLFHIDLLSNFEISLIIIAFSGYVLLYLQEGLFDAGFRCEGNYALGVACIWFVRLFEWVLLFFAVGCGLTPVGAAFALLAGRSIGTILLRLILRVKSPWITYGFKYVRYSTLKRLAAPTMAFMAFSLSEATNIQGMVLVIGVALGPVAVAVFSTFRTISRTGVQASAVVYRAVWPEMTTAFGTNNLDLARNLYYRVANVTFWASLMVVSVVAVSGDWIIPLWTNNKIPLDDLLLFLMLGVAVTDSLWQTSQTVLASANRHKRSAVMYLTSTVAALLLSYVLISALNAVEGAALSLLVSNVLMILYTTRRALSLVQGELWTYMRRLLLPPLVSSSGRQN